MTSVPFAPARRGRLAVAGFALVAFLVALGVRRVNAVGAVVVGTPAEPEAWASMDPDTLYHARRAARGASEDGRVSGRDDLLAWPEHAPRPGDAALEGFERGASIPWPPYYDMLLARLVPPGVEPGDPPRELARVEEVVASTPSWLGALAAGVAALAAGALAGPTAAGVAGLGLAFTFAHLRYSLLGNGDHHAAASLLHLGMLALLGLALRAASLRRPVRAALWSGGSGVLAGLLLGTWVAGFAWIVVAQVAAAVALLRSGAARQPTALVGSTFHKAVIVVALPAILWSPWSEAGAFSVVNLSWFHLVWLGAGWLVFAPLALVPRVGPRAMLLGPAALAAAFAFLPLRGALGEAWAWGTATDPFMASITESQPLAWGAAGGVARVLKHLGWSVLALPFAWWVLAARSGRRGDPAALPWTLTVALLAPLALVQTRFGEALAGPLAVTLGVGAAAAVQRLAGAEPRRRAAYVAGACVLAAALHARTFQLTAVRAADRLGGAPRFVETPAARRTAAEARALATLSELDRETGDAAERAGVLAQWDLGHAIEWRAGLPTVATNFGSYVGEEAFLDPWRALYGVDDAAIEHLLERRRVRWVVATATDDRNRVTGAAAVGSTADHARTLDARLRAPAGGAAAEGGAPAYLRLAHVEPLDGAPAVWIWERVAGARVEVVAPPGTSVAVRVRLDLGADLGEHTWTGRAVAGAGGIARVRVPYATEGRAGRAGSVEVLGIRVVGPDGERALQVPEAAVREGGVVRP